MWDENNSSWPFAEVADDGLDISKIFGAASANAVSNPFDAQQETLVSSEAELPVVEKTKEEQAIMPVATSTFDLIDPHPQKETQPSASKQPVPENPLASAIEQTAAENTKKGLLEKSPVFCYGSAKEEIKDAAMTFEELRIAKSDDFPELSEGKRVSWSVEYGKVTKTITDPKGTTIQSIKEEIERSKAFLDGLKKAKDKNPDCLVKPRVTAQSKGIASYRGVFGNLEDARRSGKTICLIPSRDGKVYELRKTELGEFIAPKNNVVDFQTVRAGFTPALPLIPMSLLRQVISFFRCYMEGEKEFEALVHILWDRQLEKFTIHVPKQVVSKARIDADLSQDMPDEERYLHYADVHSHNSMAAKFSEQDNRDELATGIYIVLGRLDQFFPSISVRMSCGGTYHELPPGTVIEGLNEAFPKQWTENVKTANRAAAEHALSSFRVRYRESPLYPEDPKGETRQ